MFGSCDDTNGGCAVEVTCDIVETTLDARCNALRSAHVAAILAAPGCNHTDARLALSQEEECGSAENVSDCTCWMATWDTLEPYFRHCASYEGAAWHGNCPLTAEWLTDTCAVEGAAFTLPAYFTYPMDYLAGDVSASVIECGDCPWGYPGDPRSSCGDPLPPDTYFVFKPPKRIGLPTTWMLKFEAGARLKGTSTIDHEATFEYRIDSAPWVALPTGQSVFEVPVSGLGDLVVQARSSARGQTDASPASFRVTIQPRVVDAEAHLDAQRAEIVVSFSDSPDVFASENFVCEDVFAPATVTDLLGTGAACYRRSEHELAVQLGTPGNSDGSSNSVCERVRDGDSRFSLVFVEDLFSSDLLYFDGAVELALPRVGPALEARIAGASLFGACSPMSLDASASDPGWALGETKYRWEVVRIVDPSTGTQMPPIGSFVSRIGLSEGPVLYLDGNVTRFETVVDFEYSITVTVENCIGKTAASAPHVVAFGNAPLAAVTVQGPALRRHMAAQPLRLASTVAFPAVICRQSVDVADPVATHGEGALEYAWRVIDGDVPCIERDKVPMVARDLVLPARCLNVGSTYVFGVTTTYLGTRSHEATVEVAAESSPAEAFLTGGTYRRVGSSGVIVLDASKCTDPDSPNAPVSSVVWSCRTVSEPGDHTTTYDTDCDPSVAEALASSTTAVLELPPQTVSVPPEFTNGRRFRIRADVTVGEKTAVAFQTLEIVEGLAVEVNISVAESLSRAGDELIFDSAQRQVVTAAASVEGNADVGPFSWSAPGGGFGRALTSGHSNAFIGGAGDSQLQVLAGFLSPGAVYTLQAVADAPEHERGLARVTILASGLPHGGNIKGALSTGGVLDRAHTSAALATEVALYVSGWIDGAGSPEGLTYEFGVLDIGRRRIPLTGPWGTIGGSVQSALAPVAATGADGLATAYVDVDDAHGVGATSEVDLAFVTSPSDVIGAAEAVLAAAESTFDAVELARAGGLACATLNSALDGSADRRAAVRKRAIAAARDALSNGGSRSGGDALAAGRALRWTTRMASVAFAYAPDVNAEAAFEGVELIGDALSDAIDAGTRVSVADMRELVDGLGHVVEAIATSPHVGGVRSHDSTAASTRAAELYVVPSPSTSGSSNVPPPTAASASTMPPPLAARRLLQAPPPPPPSAEALAIITIQDAMRNARGVASALLQIMVDGDGAVGGPLSHVSDGEVLSLAVKRLSQATWPVAREAAELPLGSKWHLPPASAVSVAAGEDALVVAAFTEHSPSVLRSPVLCSQGRCLAGVAVTMATSMSLSTPVAVAAHSQGDGGTGYSVTLPVKHTRQLSATECVTCAALLSFGPDDSGVDDGAAGFYYDLMHTEDDMLYGVFGEVTCAQPEMTAAVDTASGTTSYIGEVTCTSVRAPASLDAGEALEVMAFLVQMPEAEEPPTINIEKVSTMQEYWYALGGVGAFFSLLGVCCLLFGKRRSQRYVLSDAELASGVQAGSSFFGSSGSSFFG